MRIRWPVNEARPERVGRPFRAALRIVSKENKNDFK
jgi:hypothetical protein